MLKIAVSRCLLGDPVRYDGTGKFDPEIAAWSGRLCWVPLCPECGAGFGVPRETIELTGDPAAPELRTTGTRRDVSAAMRCWAAAELERLEAAGVGGFLLKARSPSCGSMDTPVYGAGHRVIACGGGFFVRQLRERRPGWPVIDENGWRNPAERGEFLRRAACIAAKSGIDYPII